MKAKLLFLALVFALGSFAPAAPIAFSEISLLVRMREPDSYIVHDYLEHENHPVYFEEFAKRAEDGSLSLADLRGGTFTITNGGVFGSLLSTPILNPPQVGILGLHAIQQRPVAVNGQVVVHPMMYVALTYDHRIVDGAEAVQFLVRIKTLVEDPAALLLE